MSRRACAAKVFGVKPWRIAINTDAAFTVGATSEKGHSLPMKPVLPAGPCPLRSESDLHPALPRNDAKGQKLTYASQQNDVLEFLVLHSSSASARRISPGGISSPSALAVLRLTTISSLVGCSTGRSAGFTPFRILST